MTEKLDKLKKQIHMLKTCQHLSYKERLKHLRGRHDQLDHAWNRGTGGGTISGDEYQAGIKILDQQVADGEIDQETADKTRAVLRKKANDAYDAVTAASLGMARIPRRQRISAQLADVRANDIATANQPENTGAVVSQSPVMPRATAFNTMNFTDQDFQELSEILEKAEKKAQEDIRNGQTPNVESTLFLLGYQANSPEVSDAIDEYVSNIKYQRLRLQKQEQERANQIAYEEALANIKWEENDISFLENMPRDESIYDPALIDEKILPSVLHAGETLRLWADNVFELSGFRERMSILGLDQNSNTDWQVFSDLLRVFPDEFGDGTDIGADALPRANGDDFFYLAYESNRPVAGRDVTASTTVDISHKDKKISIHNTIFKAIGSGRAGFGHVMMMRQISAASEIAKRLGYTVDISTSAVSSEGQGYNGYHTWPKLGYNFEIPNSIRRYLLRKGFTQEEVAGTATFFQSQKTVDGISPIQIWSDLLEQFKSDIDEQSFVGEMRITNPDDIGLKILREVNERKKKSKSQQKNTPKSYGDEFGFSNEDMQLFENAWSAVLNGKSQNKKYNQDKRIQLKQYLAQKHQQKQHAFTAVIDNAKRLQTQSNATYKHKPGGKDHDQSSHAWNAGTGRGGGVSVSDMAIRNPDYTYRQKITDHPLYSRLSSFTPQQMATVKKGILDNISAYTAAARKAADQVRIAANAYRQNPTQTNRAAFAAASNTYDDSINQIAKNISNYSLAVSVQRAKFDMQHDALKLQKRSIDGKVRSQEKIKEAYEKTLQRKDISPESRALSEKQRDAAQASIDRYKKQMESVDAQIKSLLKQIDDNNLGQKHVLPPLYQALRHPNPATPIMDPLSQQMQAEFSSDPTQLSATEREQFMKMALAMFPKPKARVRIGQEKKLRAQASTTVNPNTGDIDTVVGSSVNDHPEVYIHEALHITSRMFPEMQQEHNRWADKRAAADQNGLRPLNDIYAQMYPGTVLPQFNPRETAYQDAVDAPYTLKRYAAENDYREVVTMAFTDILETWRKEDPDLLRMVLASIMKLQ